MSDQARRRNVVINDSGGMTRQRNGQQSNHADDHEQSTRVERQDEGGCCNDDSQDEDQQIRDPAGSTRRSCSTCCCRVRRLRAHRGCPTAAVRTSRAQSSPDRCPHRGAQASNARRRQLSACRRCEHHAHDQGADSGQSADVEQQLGGRQCPRRGGTGSGSAGIALAGIAPPAHRPSMRTPTLARSADTSTVPGAGPTTTPRPPRPPRSSAAGPRGQWPWPDAPPRDRARAIAMPPANSTAATGARSQRTSSRPCWKSSICFRGEPRSSSESRCGRGIRHGWRRHRDVGREAQLTGHRMAVGRHDSVRNRVSAGIDQPLDGLHDDCLGDHRGAVLPVTSVCARDDDGDETSVYRLARRVGSSRAEYRAVPRRRDCSTRAWCARAQEGRRGRRTPRAARLRRSRHRAPFSRRHRRQLWSEPRNRNRRDDECGVRVLRARAVDPAGSRGAACPVEPLTARDDARMSGGARAS